MTIQEANALIDDFSFVYKGESISREGLVECREVIHRVLEKQIPKKPLKQKFGFCDLVGFFDFRLVCPECEQPIDKKEYKARHCHNCGQALDWSSEVEDE
jgi:hypothetical protein